MRILNLFKVLNKHIHHKWYVLKYCFKAGLYWRGITHDLSKFSCTEMKEAVKYYTQDRSYVRNAKDAQHYSLGWIHHRGRNTHHYEYWRDTYQHHEISLRIPFDDVLELICDGLGAARSYGKTIDFQRQYDYYDQATKEDAVHPQSRAFILGVYKRMVEEQDVTILKQKSELRKIWDEAVASYGESPYVFHRDENGNIHEIK